MFDVLIQMSPATIVGTFASTIAITWPLFRTRKGMLIGQVGVHIGFGLHFFLLGANTGALMNLFALIQAVAAIPLGKHKAFRMIYILTLPFIAVGAIATWQGLPSFFSSLGLAFISLGRYQLNVQSFRIILMIAIFFWFAHNVSVGSIPGMISDTFGGALNMAMILKERRKQMAAATH